MSAGIKDTMDVLNLLESAVKAEMAAFADGQITPLEQIRIAVSLLPQIRDAFVGINNVPVEIEGLDSEEIKVLWDKFLEILGLVFKL